MATSILMPSLSPTMTEGTIVSWRKQVGESVRTGDVLLEVETDKAVVEVEATTDGILDQILHPEGSGPVAVGEPVAMLKTGPSNQTISESPADDDFTADATVPNIPSERTHASPLAKRLAKEMSVDLGSLVGSGPDGRIIKADVMRGAENHPNHGAHETSTVESGYESRHLSRTVPHSSMRRTIARRLTEAAQTVPHFHLSVDCDVDALLALKSELHAGGTRLTLTDFIIKASARALVRIPEANASWTPDAMQFHRNADISVAVSTPEGLWTPIIFEAEKKSISEISHEMRSLIELAHEGKLAPAQYQGGSFSISNLGKWGVHQFTAIINPPQACILAVGATRQQAVVRNGKLCASTLITCTLSADHRVIDGALAAAFLSEIRQGLEKPVLLLV